MISFIFTNILLGVGLAMDAFSVSLANGLKEPTMKIRKNCLIALTFAVFQAVMPLIGWALVKTVAETFTFITKFIPYIALILLLYIGGKMIFENVVKKNGENGDENASVITLLSILVQGVATSIDALSVGFTIVEYDLLLAILATSIIAVVTFIISYIGVILGKKFGTKLSGKAEILGGIILIAIGIEIFFEGIL